MNPVGNVESFVIPNTNDHHHDDEGDYDKFY